MADSTDTAAAGEEARSPLECRYCHQLGADVCIGITPSASGSGHALYAHRGCATERGIPVLYTVTAGTGRAS